MNNTDVIDHAVDWYASLVKDVEQLMGMEGSLAESLEALTRAVRSRGLPVLLRDLPQSCQDLERSLEIGWYKKDKATGALSGLEAGGYLPKFLRPLYGRVFSPGGVILEDPCPHAVRHLRQLLRCFKKFSIACPKLKEEEAVNAFIQIERELPRPRLSWGRRDLRSNSGWPDLVSLVRDNLRRTEIRTRLSEIDRDWSDDWLLRLASWAQSAADSVVNRWVYDHSNNPKHGPGAVSEAYTASKYEFPTWGWRLEKFFPFDTYGVVNWLDDKLIESSEEERGIGGFRTELPSKLIPVPKDYNGPRLIASEPISAQFIQQAIMLDLRKKVGKSVLRHSIDFRDQLPSGLAALAASESGAYATIDLKSASDRLSCAVVECVFRNSFSYLEVLNSARTPTVCIPGRLLGARQDLILDVNKFACQGAADTFPVQSIVYTLLAYGVEGHSRFMQSGSGGRSRLTEIAREVRVFGDDIICPRSSSTDLKLLLTALDLVVNEAKSFSTGLFRESCGIDAFRGHNVTPTYVQRFFQDQSPLSLLSTIEVSNALYLSGYLHASRWFVDSIPVHVRKDVPWVAVGSNTLGFVGPNIWASKRRFSRILHRFEVRVMGVERKPKDLPTFRKEVRNGTLVRVKTPLNVQPEGRDGLTQWFFEKPRPDMPLVYGRAIATRYVFSVRWVEEQSLSPA
nr:MAG: hypothetical protein 3 [Leviviridae sp.]